MTNATKTRSRKAKGKKPRQFKPKPVTPETLTKAKGLYLDLRVGGVIEDKECDIEKATKAVERKYGYEAAKQASNIIDPRED